MADSFGGSSSNAMGIQARAGGATSATPGSGNCHPLQIVARMARLLDQQNVDTNNRWLVVDPVFCEVLKDEDSRLLNGDFGGSGLQNGLILNNYLKNLRRKKLKKLLKKLLTKFGLKKKTQTKNGSSWKNPKGFGNNLRN